MVRETPFYLICQVQHYIAPIESLNTLPLLQGSSIPLWLWLSFSLLHKVNWGCHFQKYSTSACLALFQDESVSIAIALGSCQWISSLSHVYEVRRECSIFLHSQHSLWSRFSPTFYLPFAPSPGIFWGTLKADAAVDTVVPCKTVCIVAGMSSSFYCIRLTLLRAIVCNLGGIIKTHHDWNKHQGVPKHSEVCWLHPGRF